MLRREVEDGLLEFCAKSNIGVVVYSPMQRGLLTGKFSRQYLKTLAPDDHRLRMPEFTGAVFSANIEFVEKLKPIAKRTGRTLSQLAISWVLRRSEVTAAIVGARRPEQVAETAKAGDLELTAEDIEQIEQLLKERQEKINGK
jgi:aryl-alcohol dehydrogenase-like predicted oxidoreductase